MRYVLVLALLQAPLSAACDKGEADLTIVNNTSGTWVELFVKDDDHSDWGLEHLRGITIEPSLSFEVKDLPDRSSYDIRVVDDAGFAYTEAIRVSFDDETVTLTDSDLSEGVVDVIIRNSTTSSWDKLFVKERNDDAWGVDVLGQTDLGPGASYSLPVDIKTVIDVRAEGADGLVYEEPEVGVFGKAAIIDISAQHQATQGRVRVVNAIDYGNGGDNSVVAVFIALSSETGAEDGWGPDRLTDMIPNAGDREFELDPGTYDVRCVDVSGKTYQQMGKQVTAGWSVEARFTTGDVK